MTDALVETGAFDRLSPLAAEMLLRPCCASRVWIDALVAGRPFGVLAALVARSDDVLAGLGWPDLEEALAAHPRIGERPAGAGRESLWSRQEQSGAAADGAACAEAGAAADAEADATAALRAGNVEYERRFGHVFLICATGRSSEEILTALRDRLGNDEGVEREVVRHELTEIVRLRLAKTLR
jgi:2-oxo-4-hydroxy-4-carboxy-5-ureidoimidazoline decarboxylase